MLSGRHDFPSAPGMLINGGNIVVFVTSLKYENYQLLFLVMYSFHVINQQYLVCSGEKQCQGFLERTGETTRFTVITTCVTHVTHVTRRQVKHSTSLSFGAIIQFINNMLKYELEHKVAGNEWIKYELKFTYSQYSRISGRSVH